jgi:cytochrome c-type biogenesis protein CcmH/NrfG
MSRRQASAAVAGDATEFATELRARFGLPPDATMQDIEVARDRVVAFLGSVPPSLRSWAAGELATVNQAFMLLSEMAAGDGTGSTVDGDDGTAREQPGATSTDADVEDADVEDGPAKDGPAKEENGSDDAAEGTEAELDAAELDELGLDEDDMPEPGRRHRRPASVTAPAPPTRPGGKRPPARITAAGNRARRRARGRREPSVADHSWHNKVIVGLLVALLIAIVWVVYEVGKPSVPGIAGAPTATASPAPTVDQAKVAQLMSKLAANPKDVDALWQLGQAYMDGQDFKTAGDFERQILAIQPKNTRALVALGICEFNTGDLANAEKDWLAAVAVDPKLIDAHYNLGFLYLSQNKMDKVRAEWNKVVQIDPTSEYAKNVSTHLQSLNPSASPSGAATPAASASPAGK